MQRYAHVTGWGMAVPEKVLTNHDLARLVDTDDEWIVSRTGIRERRIANERETTATLAVEAAREALDVAAVSPEEIDLIIVSTSTPEHIFPATASLVQDGLGAVNAGAFDILAACTGFVYALTIGSQAIQTGGANVVLVIGSETLSKVLNWEDRGTCILFGDGAGAFVLQGSETPGGFLSSILRSDGSGGDLLSIPAGGSRNPTNHATLRDNLHTIHMNGREVFRFATRVMASACREVMEEAGLTPEDIDLIIPHQANRRIIDSAARALRMPEEKFVINLDRYGNTSTASIPIAVCEAVEDGRLKPDDNIVFVAFGAGLTWGATVMQWNGAIPKEDTPLQRTRRRMLYRMAWVRSFFRRGARALEGAIWGGPGSNGYKPAPREQEQEESKNGVPD